MKTVSANNIDNAIYDVKSKMYKKYSVDESERFISPLIYYINTGRASTEFLRILVNLTERQKSTIANKLIKNYGNTENAINSICKYVGFTRNCFQQIKGIFKRRYAGMKVYYRFNNMTCAKTFTSKKEMEAFFEKYSMLQIIRIEKIQSRVSDSKQALG